MNLKLNPFYKRFMLYVIVIVPFFWFVFTNDGQRRSDLLLMSLFYDEEPMNLALDKVSPANTIDQIRKNFPELDFQCADGRTPYGDKICKADIGSFYGTPSHYATLFYGNDLLNAVKVVYHGRYHEHLLREMYRLLGDPVNPAKEGELPPVFSWRTPQGMVAAKGQVPDPQEEAAVLWVSAALTPP